MNTPSKLSTIDEYLTDDEKHRLEQKREKKRWKARTQEQRDADSQVLENKIARREYIEYQTEQMREREQTAIRDIAALKERREAYLREEAEKAKRSKSWFGCMGPFGSCGRGVTRKRKPNSKKNPKPNSKKKPKPNSNKKRKPRDTTNKRRNKRTGR